MSEYHKIQTVWLRDPDTNFKTLLDGQWAKPEFGWLAGNEWMWTEKVDGTNIRLNLDLSESSVAGRTDNASLHPHLLAKCEEYLQAAYSIGLTGLTLYGEGYGAGIQKGGGNYGPAKDLVLFDACTAAGLWLERSNVEDIAAKIGARIVPIVGRGTLLEAIEAVRKGMTSQWGAFASEGLVIRPAVELRNRFGERVITKLKCKDFADARQVAA